jgi:hypothetical protein
MMMTMMIVIHAIGGATSTGGYLSDVWSPTPVTTCTGTPGYYHVPLDYNGCIQCPVATYLLTGGCQSWFVLIVITHIHLTHLSYVD